MESRHRKLLTSLLNLMKEPTFGDLTLHLKDDEVTASRIVMASLSPPIRSMLTHELRERVEGEANFPTISKQAWKCITRFYLTDERPVTPANVEEMTQIAHMYELYALKEHCDDVFSRIPYENVLTELNFAETYGLEESSRALLKITDENFASVSRSEDFLSLEKEDLVKLLKRPSLEATEDDVCLAVLAWLESKSADETTAHEVLHQVKLPDVSTDCLLSRVMYHNQVRNNEDSRSAVVEELRRRHGEPSSCDGPQMPYARNATGAQDVLVVGRDRNRSIFAVYSRRRNQWQTVYSPIDFGELPAAVMHGDFVYVTGGTTASRSMHILDTVGSILTTGPQLGVGRCQHGMTCIGESLYVVAGMSFRTDLSSIEELRLGSDRWMPSGHLQFPVCNCGLATVRTLIIAVGGTHGSNRVQTFDVRTKTASILTVPVLESMLYTRGASLSNGAVFLGEKGHVVHIEDPGNVQDIARNVPLHLFDPRRSFGLLAQSGCLTIVGGGVNGSPGSSVDTYTPQGSKVEKDRFPSLPVALKVHGVFILRLPMYRAAGISLLKSCYVTDL